jgi:hypothetical protein
MSTKVFVNGRALAVAAIGLVMGLLAVLTIGDLLESALFGVSSTGPRIGTGSTEIAPHLGVADVIVDLTSTGSTLRA